MLKDETSNSNEYLETGEQGKITETVLQLSERIPGEGELLIRNITAYIHSLRSIKTKEPDFSRTADQIIQSGEQWGCHEAGLVFVTLLRSKGENASYIQTFLREDLRNYDPKKPSYRRGHVFLRQQTDAGFRIINTTTGEITEEIPETYVFGAEGKDSWDIGLKHGSRDYLPMFEKVKYENKL